MIYVPMIGNAATYTGKVELESRYFPTSPQFNDQHGSSLVSTAVELEAYYETESGNDSLTIKPFYRYDEHDDERTHGDVREFVWAHVGSIWETKVGISKVFWGVTESQHLVDIINQTDLVEAIDGEEKLGQPMFMLSLVGDWLGILDIYVLPGFRERNFAGQDGRLRAPFDISDNAIYESNNEDNHIDIALRWSHSIGDAEIALSHFSGTSREPGFVPNATLGVDPFYGLIEQTGLEYQIALGEWLWKLEAIRRHGYGPSYFATVGGFEYTLVGVRDTDIDIGLILEYHFDERQDDAATILQNDSFLGMRFALNDAQSTEILAGFIIDNDTQANIFSVEASRRIGNNIRLRVEAGAYSGVDKFEIADAISGRLDLLSGFRNDDYIEIAGTWYF